MAFRFGRFAPRPTGDGPDCAPRGPGGGLPGFEIFSTIAAACAMLLGGFGHAGAAADAAADAGDRDAQLDSVARNGLSQIPIPRDARAEPLPIATIKQISPKSSMTWRANRCRAGAAPRIAAIDLNPAAVLTDS